MSAYFHISVFTWSLLEVSMWVFEYLLNVNCIFEVVVRLFFDIAFCVKLLIYFNNQHTIQGIHSFYYFSNSMFLFRINDHCG